MLLLTQRQLFEVKRKSTAIASSVCTSVLPSVEDTKSMADNWPPDRRKVPKFHPKFCKVDLWSKERPDLHDNIETINVAVCSLAEFIFDPQVSLAYLFFHLRSKTFYVVRHVSLSSLSKASIVGFVLRGGRWADMCNSSVPDKFARTTVAFSSAFLQNGHQLY